MPHKTASRVTKSGKIKSSLADDYAGTGSGPKALTAAHKEARKFMESTAHYGSSTARVRGDMVRDAIHMAPHPKSKTGGMIHGGIAAARHGQAPPATSMMGSLGIIEHPSNRKEYNMGIPGIITSTSLGPEQRARLVSGIIESPMAGEHASGPVHKVMGHDATAYNAGMVHLRGSHFK